MSFPASDSDLEAVSAEHRSGNFAGAITGYERLLAERPGDVRILANLATALKQAGRSAEALACFRRAIAADDTVPALWFNFANLLSGTGQLDEAEAGYRRAVALDPRLYPAFTNLGNLLARRGRAGEAIAAHRESLRLAPGNTASLRVLGRLLFEQARQPEEAARLYRAALSQDPRHADTWNALGVVLEDLGQGAEAVGCWEKALALAPHHASAHNNLGAMHRLMRQPQRAIEHLRAALRFAPHDPVAAANLAHTLLDLGQITEAAAIAQRVTEEHPGHSGGHLMLGFALVLQGRIEEAFAAFLEAHRLAPQSSSAISNALFASLYSDARDAAQHLATHRELAGKIAPAGPVRTSWTRARDPDRPLRVGYVSADLRKHPVACFLEPILRHHDRARIEVFAYGTGVAPDEVTARLRSHAAVWRDCPRWNDARLAAQIEADAIDILVDLAGYTAQNRAPLMRQRLAPIQVLYIGYPCTSGIADYLIADARVCPPECERFYTERIARVAGSFWCYEPHAHAPNPGPLPARTQAGVTFGSFNALPKISATTVALWSRVLVAVPGSRLVLKAASFADAPMRDAVRRRFADSGVAPERVLIEPPVMEHANFLPEYRRLDIALDPVPYNGGTTTCEALWMGVPVVTLPGTHFFTRMSFSFLQNMGLPQLAASSADDYVRLAAELAADLPRLEALRGSLRARMAASPICDGSRAAQELEGAFRAMWHEWLATPAP